MVFSYALSPYNRALLFFVALSAVDHGSQVSFHTNSVLTTVTDPADTIPIATTDSTPPHNSDTKSGKSHIFVVFYVFIVLITDGIDCRGLYALPLIIFIFIVIVIVFGVIIYCLIKVWQKYN